ncbi:MAG: hypothetical protein ABIE70_12195 [bacterium]
MLLRSSLDELSIDPYNVLMLMILLRRCLVVPVILAVVGALVFGGTGHVLCVSDDGQVKIELACTPGDDCGGGCPEAEDEPCPDHDDCGDCSDLSTAGGAFRRGSAAADVNLDEFTPSVSHISYADLHTVSGGHPLLPETGLSPGRSISAIISSVVLRC